MRAAAILGLGTSMRELNAFQCPGTEIVLGLPATSEGLSAILIFGGDGTVHRHLEPLLKLQLPVLVVPAGSGNDFARALGLRHAQDSLAAWQMFCSGKHNLRRVDVGTITRINVTQAETTPKPDADNCGRPSLPREETPGKVTYFSCVAGVGLDGEIARRANVLPRWLRAHGGYALSLPGALLSFRPFVLKLSVADTRCPTRFCLRCQEPVTLAVFANTPVYGGGMKVAPRARMDDAQLDVCLIRDIPRLKLLSLFPSVYFGRHLGIREVEYFPIAGARLETERPLDIYADGEYVCQTPVEIGLAKAALSVIVRE